ncbi:hypothetical protein GCM10022281_11550 [Sphingomonas rosea]|uniref:Uncharacterized protein n=1 Tax=Sphingomonas rosea TaxID=335605 RepID=A0ABP7TZ61_9SPHN
MGLAPFRVGQSARKPLIPGENFHASQAPPPSRLCVMIVKFRIGATPPDYVNYDNFGRSADSLTTRSPQTRFGAHCLRFVQLLVPTREMFLPFTAGLAPFTRAGVPSR